MDQKTILKRDMIYEQGKARKSKGQKHINDNWRFFH